MDRSLRQVALSIALCGIAHAEPFIVAGDKGVLELDEGGAVVRTLTQHKASSPRWSSDKTRVYYLTRTELRVVALDGTSDKRVAKLPLNVHACAAYGEPAQTIRVDNLGIQDDRDFTVDDKRACFSLKDRNDNMLSFELRVKVDLATNVLSSGLAFPECKGQHPPCEPQLEEHGEEHEPPAAPFDVVDGHLLHDGKRVLDLGDFAPQTVSPSGRWALLHGHEQEADYIHFDALLLDRQDGALYSFGAWEGDHDRRSLTVHKLTAKERRQVKRGEIRTTDIVAERLSAWRGEHLILGSDLVLPGEAKVVPLPGDVVR